MNQAVIDAVIPVYKPGAELKELVRRLELQQHEIRMIYLMHTKDGNNLVHSEFLKGYNNIMIEEVEPEEFDHGGTRDSGIRMSDADYVLCMTQDAVPADSRLTERLLEGMQEEDVAVAFARQLPKRDCHLLERYTRSFNYPEQSRIKSKDDLDTLGIKTYFNSNVCALYRRDIYVRQGGFEKKIIFSEDMIYAAGCIQNGYKVSYVADARVIHSHNYTNWQQFCRNFDIAVAQAQHPEIFKEVRSESEGIRMVKSTAGYLLKKRQPLMILSLLTSSASKYLGFLAGKNYKLFPKKIVLRCTTNPRYWGES